MDNNINIYEIRLREEFNNLRKLLRYPEMSKIISIEYIDRISRERKSIETDPFSSNTYPEKYIVTYSIPLYTGRGRLNNKWSGDFTITVSQEVLLDPHTSTPPGYDLDTSNGVPFNQHIDPGWVCIGGVWSVAKDFGIWYFVVGIGGLLNQEPIWMEDDGSGHLNAEAYDYWKNERNKQPINDIKWILTLQDDLKISDKVERGSAKRKFVIGQTKKLSIGNSMPKKASFKIKK